MDTHYIDPGSLWQNAYNESFNSIFRITCLDRWLFGSMTEARVVIRQWLEEYNTIGRFLPVTASFFWSFE